MYAVPASFRNATRILDVTIGSIVHVPVFGSFVTVDSDNLSAIRDAVALCLMGSVQVAVRPAVSLAKLVHQDA